MRKYNVLSSILIPRTGQYYQTGLVVTDEDVNEEEAKSLIEKGVLKEIPEKKTQAKSKAAKK